MSHLPREQAEELNPLIGNITADTLNNISSGLDLLMDLSVNEPEIHLTRSGTQGFFVICECLKAALAYENTDREAKS